MLGDRGLGIRLRAEIAFAMTPRMISVSSGEGLRSSLPWIVRVVTSTSEPAGTKRSGLGMNSCRQRRAKVACVQPTFTSLPRPLAAFLNMSQAPFPGRETRRIYSLTPPRSDISSQSHLRYGLPSTWIAHPRICRRLNLAKTHVQHIEEWQVSSRIRRGHS